MPKRKSLKIGLQSIAEAQQLFGQQDSFLKAIESNLSAHVLLRSDYLEVVGDDGDVETAAEILNELLGLARSGASLEMNDIQAAVHKAVHPQPKEKNEQAPEETGGGALSALAIHAKQGPIRPRSKNQSLYIEAMRRQDLVFGVGPAGTGKTYLAMAMAASALKSGTVDRIMMTRPAVGSRRETGLSARRHPGKDRPVSAPALRRPLRYVSHQHHLAIY